MQPVHSEHLETRKDCPDSCGVLISVVEDVLWQSIMNLLALVCGMCPQ